MTVDADRAVCIEGSRLPSKEPHPLLHELRDGGLTATRDILQPLARKDE